MKICKTDKSALITYLIITVICLGLSSIAFAFDTKYSYFPIVITAISFVCGFFYLWAMLYSMKKRLEITEENKGMRFAGQMGSNFLRFSIMVIAVLCNFLFVYFTPVEGEPEKWVYALILIAGLPMIIDIALFYLRSAYVE